MTANIASEIKFNELCDVFEAIRKAKAKEKSDVLLEFIKKFRRKAAELKTSNANADISFYPILRLFLPQLERERGAYGLKEYAFAKKLIKIMCLPAQGADAKRLLNFRSTTNTNVKDFADMAYWMLKGHFIRSAKLSIQQINDYLDSIAQKHANNDPRGVEDTIEKVFNETAAEEQRWLMRIILKDLRLGIGHNKILSLYHPDAVDYYSTNNSLSKVCDTLKSLSIRLHEMEISVFSPFQPMLSKKCDAAEFKKLSTQNMKVYIENKFDGERFQLHMEHNKFKYFSRNGYDYSKDYGETFTTGLFTPKLQKAFRSDVKRIILDGEMMGWNSLTKQFGSKGMNFDVKHLKADTTYQPCFCVFDIVLLNDKVLTNKPLRHRLNVMNDVLKPVHGVLLISHRTESTIGQETLDALNKSMDRNEEGIVFKDMESIYKSNNRNAGWWKMKLEYFENVMSDLDLIIIGGYYGDGRYRRRISGFLLGIAVPPSDGKSRIPYQFISFARVSSGLSNAELEKVDEKLNTHWRKLTEGNPQDFGVEWAKDKPDMWIPPEKSCVVEVRASEMIRVFSKEFMTDYTLRFPRILKLRFDKPYYDCLTTDDLQNMTNSKSVQKLTKRHLDMSDLETPEKERKTKRRYVAEEVQPVEQTSEVLSGLEFCVLTGSEEWNKQAVEAEIRENGGVVVKNEGTETLCILVGMDHPRVSSCKQFDAPCDLVQLQWLRDVLDSKTFKTYTPRDTLHASKKTRARFAMEYDKYGDSYTEPATLETLKESMAVIEKSGDYLVPMPSEMQQLDDELNIVNPLTAFKTCVAYFDEPGRDYKTHSDSSSKSIEELEFKFLGGTVKNIVDESTTHIFLEHDENLRRGDIMQYLQIIGNTHAEIMDKAFIHNKYEEVKRDLNDG